MIGSRFAIRGSNSNWSIRKGSTSVRFYGQDRLLNGDPRVDLSNTLEDFSSNPGAGYLGKKMLSPEFHFLNPKLS